MRGIAISPTRGSTIFKSLPGQALTIAVFGLLVGSPALAADSEFLTRVRPYLADHCVRCHGEADRKAGLRLDSLSDDFASGETAGVWREVVDRINAGTMPPKKEPRPDAKKTAAVVAAITSRLRATERAAKEAGGRVLLRRLNRTQYVNTVRDLLELRPPVLARVVAEIPSDGVVDGFDNIGAGLLLDPSLLDKYLAAAKIIAEEVIVSGPPPAPTKKRRFEFKSHGDERTGNYIPDGIPNPPPGVLVKKAGPTALTLLHGPGIEKFRMGTSGSDTSCDFGKEMVPIEGEYVLRIRAGAYRGEHPEPVKVRLIQGADGANKPPIVFEVTAPEDKPDVYEFRLHLKPDEPTGFQLSWNGASIVVDNPEFQQLASRIWGGLGEVDKLAAAGAPKEKIEAQIAKARAAQAEGKVYHGGPAYILRPGLDLAQAPRLDLEYAELEGPIFDPWPPAGHTRLFFGGAKADKGPAYAREVLRRFMNRAYRRPATEAEVERVAQWVQAERAKGRSFEEAIRLGVQAVLASPNFLYLVEPSVDAGGAAQRLTDWELASRLSYFLWSTMPDEELFALAAAKKLRDPAVLKAQAARMLKDPRSEALVTNFAGQWLHVREFGTVQPAKDIYPKYDPELDAAAKEEPLAFFREVLRNDLSVLSFLDSDFAVVNGRLAEHYGIAGVTGSQFRRVALKPEHHRGGVLTQAGLLTLLADGTRTLPVRRGAWILTNILNDPPNPPPPNAGEIQPNTAGKHLTVRERLELHKRDATCASCHVKIDAYGYALENYDAVGAWRVRQNGEKGFDPKSAPPVDASGTLPDGRKFSGPDDFKKALLERKDRFAAALSEKLLMYALGRPVRATDRETTTEVAAALKAADYRITALVHAIVASDAFQTK